MLVLPVNGGGHNGGEGGGGQFFGELPGFRVKQQQSLFPDAKQQFVVYFHDAVYRKFFSFLREAEVLEAIHAGIIEGQPFVGSCPDAALPVCDAGTDDVVAYAARILFVVLIDGKVVAVELVQPVVGSEPHVALFVLCDVDYGALR